MWCIGYKDTETKEKGVLRFDSYAKARAFFKYLNGVDGVAVESGSWSSSIWEEE